MLTRRADIAHERAPSGSNCLCYQYVAALIGVGGNDGLGRSATRRENEFMQERLPIEGTSFPLNLIKAAHTIVWAFFAGCILAIPVASWRGEHRTAACLAAIVSVEVVVLLLNHWRCPLTSVAARYTDDRRDNFDIYLPAWLARHNKLIFGPLYFIGVAYALARWIQAAG